MVMTQTTVMVVVFTLTQIAFGGIIAFSLRRRARVASPSHDDATVAALSLPISFGDQAAPALLDEHRWSEQDFSSMSQSHLGFQALGVSLLESDPGLAAHYMNINE